MPYPQELSYYKAFKSVVTFLDAFMELIVTEMLRGFWISYLEHTAFREKDPQKYMSF